MADTGETGQWNGEAVEGFVVRTHVADPSADENSHKGKLAPYPPGSTLFFKVKFDEPYMMYRDWREITKSLLTSKGAKISALRLKRAETRVYVDWVKEAIQTDKKQFDGYNKGKAIISTREKFLAWLETKEGKAAMNKAQGDHRHDSDKKTEGFGKTIIVPIAIPGCGAFFLQ
jgi:tRNA ligase